MLLRDYPQPLFDITKITIAGRMMFAEQEAQERGVCVCLINPLLFFAISCMVRTYI